MFKYWLHHSYRYGSWSNSSRAGVRFFHLNHMTNIPQRVNKLRGKKCYVRTIKTPGNRSMVYRKKDPRPGSHSLGLISVLVVTSWVTSDIPPNLSEPPFPICYTEIILCGLQPWSGDTLWGQDQLFIHPHARNNRPGSWHVYSVNDC